MKRVPYNLIVLNAFQIAFIKENFFKLTNPQIAEAIGLNLTTTRKHCYRMGFKRMNLEYWCETSIRFLRLYYRKIGDTEIAEIFTKHFPKQKGWSKKHIEKKRRYLFLKRTPAEILKINKRNVDLGRFAICPVKAWITRGGASEIGEVRIWNRGDITVAFVKTENGYTPRNRWLWEQRYGPLDRNDIIRAKPDAPVLAELKHLEKISMAEHAWENHLVDSAIIKRKLKISDPEVIKEISKNHPEIVEVYRNITIINKKLNERSGKNNSKIKRQSV